MVVRRELILDGKLTAAEIEVQHGHAVGHVVAVGIGCVEATIASGDKHPPVGLSRVIDLGGQPCAAHPEAGADSVRGGAE